MAQRHSSHLRKKGRLCHISEPKTWGNRVFVLVRLHHHNSLVTVYVVLPFLLLPKDKNRPTLIHTNLLQNSSPPSKSCFETLCFSLGCVKESVTTRKCCCLTRQPMRRNDLPETYLKNDLNSPTLTSPNSSWFQRPEERPSFFQICQLMSDALEGDNLLWTDQLTNQLLPPAATPAAAMLGPDDACVLSIRQSTHETVNGNVNDWIQHKRCFCLVSEMLFF